MLLTDFIHIFSDGVQTHEGWSETTGQSFPHNNPGNLHMEGQPGASGEDGAEALFGSFYDGKQALNNDIGAKIAAGLNTITKLISAYAPANAGNDTEAYIAAIVAFFASRNFPIGADDDIKTFIAASQIPTNLVVINGLYQPLDWAAIQASIALVATWMPQYAFATRYSNVDLSAAITTVQNMNPPGGVYSGVNGNAIKGVIIPYNQGQVLNIVIYDGALLRGWAEPFGGCEYQGMRINPVSSISSGMYQGPNFTPDYLAAIIFHEFEHGLADVCHVPDTLHAWLIARSGYNVNAPADLLSYFASAAIDNPTAVANLEKQKVALE